jgi:hypothetical protein
MSRLSPLSARRLAYLCRDRARLDTTDNMTAILLLLAAKSIEQQADRLIRLAHTLEHKATRQ